MTNLIKPQKLTRNGTKGVIDALTISMERVKFGVARTDTWCFHDYLGTVMANGIKILLEEKHGWPGGEDYPTPELWDADLRDIILRLEQATTRDEQHDKIHDEIPWGPRDAVPTGLDKKALENWLNAEKSPEFKEYIRRCNEVDDLAQENIQYVMAWLSKWWFALWD